MATMFHSSIMSNVPIMAVAIAMLLFSTGDFHPLFLCRPDSLCLTLPCVPSIEWTLTWHVRAHRLCTGGAGRQATIAAILVPVMRNRGVVVAGVSEPVQQERFLPRRLPQSPRLLLQELAAARY
jgi:hypothetical protein